MNFVIIILAGTLAYFLTEIYGIINGMYAEWELKQAKKKRLANELYRFKLKMLYKFMVNYYIESGKSVEQAKIKAMNYVISLDENDYVNEKYNYFRGFDGGYRRNKSRCK